jgi:signal transduction histidine kinase/DNA-binding NarL/FixJ family response regulator
VARSKAIQAVLTLVDKLLAEGSEHDAALREALAKLDGPERALADKLAAVALEQASWRRNLVQAAKLAEVGMSMAELVHELRQPLSGIAGFSQLLSGDPRSPDAPGWANEILHQTARMEHLLERMRRFIRSPDASSTGPVDAAKAVKEAVALFPKLPPGIQIRLEVASGLAKVRGEPGPLVQVLTNLIGNARDAIDPAPGTILVAARAHEGGGVQIVVADEGSGISPEIARRLFEPFATTKGEQGTGLGLYISREILAPWGAELRLVDPPPGFRTAFCIVLPPAEPVRAASRAGTEQSAERAIGQVIGEIAERLDQLPAERRVLIVDDEPAVRRALKVLLSVEAGLQLTEAADGPAALSVLGRLPVHVVVADKNLPGMSGVDLLRKLRERDLACEALLVTSYPSAASAGDAIEARARDYLLKPVQVEELRAAVRTAVARARWRQVARELSGELRLWAERLLQVRTAATEREMPALPSALEILAARPEGPGRVLVVSESSLIERLAMTGHFVEGPVIPEKAAALVAAERFEAMLVGRDLPHLEALALVRQARAAAPATQAMWAPPVADFEQAREVLRAGAAALIPRPIDQTTLERIVESAVHESRAEARLQALITALDELGLKDRALGARRAA